MAPKVIDFGLSVWHKTPMPDQSSLLLPDDEYYYFGVVLSDSPVKVRERLLRKPEYLYSITYHNEDEDEPAGESDTCWLYLWRCNEGYDLRPDFGDMSFREKIAQLHARHNMGLHVVLHALTEDEALNPSTYSDREPHCYILVQPSSAEGDRTVPRLNFRGATGTAACTRFHVTRGNCMPALFCDAEMAAHEPEDVPQEVIDKHELMYARRALTVLNAIHDADSLELLQPLANEYHCFVSNLAVRSSSAYAGEMQEINRQSRRKELEFLLCPWYAGSHHQQHTHPSGLVQCASYPSDGEEYSRELLDFEPGRKLCYKEKEGRVYILPAGEGDSPLPQRDGGRFHILPETCLCGQYCDEQGRIIHWV